MISNDIDTVIFDMGGTLLDYDPVPAGEMRVIRTNKITDFLNSKGYKFKPGDIEQCLIEPYYENNLIESEKTLREINLCECIKKGLERLRVAEDYSLWIIHLIHRLLKENLIVYDGSMEALKMLAPHYTLGLISNTTIPGIYFARDLEEIGMAKYFKHSIFTADWGFRKPHSSVFYRMLELLEKEAARSIYVGDSFKNDIYGPASIGMKTAWINPRNKPRPDEFADITPDYEVTSVRELAAIILNDKAAPEKLND